MGDRSSEGERGTGRDGAAGIDEAEGLVEIAGAIKWFDVAKGYGFILPDDSSHGDVLVHVTCLRRDGFQTALEGARIVCLARRGDRGMQAFRITSMDISTAVHPLDQPGDRTPDVFVHMETLRRFGVTELRPGQVVLVRYGHGDKGLMAAEIHPDKGTLPSSH